MDAIKSVVKAITSIFTGGPDTPDVAKAEDPKLAPDPQDRGLMAKQQRQTASRYASASTALDEQNNSLG